MKWFYNMKRSLPRSFTNLSHSGEGVIFFVSKFIRNLLIFEKVLILLLQNFWFMFSHDYLRPSHFTNCVVIMIAIPHHLSRGCKTCSWSLSSTVRTGWGTPRFYYFHKIMSKINIIAHSSFMQLLIILFVTLVVLIFIILIILVYLLSLLLFL